MRLFVPTGRAGQPIEPLGIEYDFKLPCLVVAVVKRPVDVSNRPPSPLDCLARRRSRGNEFLGQNQGLCTRAGEQLVACLSFGASAWKLKDRERFIGWSEAQRSRNLHLVVNNARFLILPWVRSLGLASKILSKVARQLPKDWMARYGFAPVLLETFVEFERHKGTCYKAANWTLVGRTAGRGKKSRSNKSLIPIKDIWLYPLRRDWQRILCR